MTESGTTRQLHIGTAWCAGAIIGVLCTVSASDGAWNETQKLTNPLGQPSDFFGEHGDIDGDVIVVGARGQDSPFPNGGGAHVYRRAGGVWVFEQEVLPPLQAPSDWFGHSANLDGDLLIVGAPSDSTWGDFAGEAFIYRFDGASWVLEDEIIGPDTGAYERFGWDVAIDGDVAAATAPIHSGSHAQSGAVYVWRHDGTSWVFEQKLEASDAGSLHNLGNSLALEGDVIVAGNGNIDGTGAAYVWRYNGTVWVEEQKLLASDGMLGDFFGEALDIDGNSIVVGAAGVDEIGGGSATGAAYLFQYSGSSWVETKKFTGSNAIGGDLFGLDVAISGNSVLIGADGYDHGPSSAGGAFLFRDIETDWIEEQIITASDREAGDLFGGWVALDNGTAVVGAWNEDEIANDAGSAYVYEPANAPCDGDANGDGVVDVNDISYVLFRLGSTSLDGDTNGDGIVDVNDISYVLFRLGDACP